MEQPARPPLEQASRRIARTADDLAAAIRGRSEAALARRPDGMSWAAKEIICHLRDTEELFLMRLEVIAAVDEPMIHAAGMGARAMGLKPDGVRLRPTDGPRTGNTFGATSARPSGPSANAARRRSPISPRCRRSNGCGAASIRVGVG